MSVEHGGHEAGPAIEMDLPHPSVLLGAFMIVLSGLISLATGNEDYGNRAGGISGGGGGGH